MTENTQKTGRRFFGKSAGALASAGIIMNSAGLLGVHANNKPNTGEKSLKRNRVGGVAYSYQYSIGLFKYNNRPGGKFDAMKFLEANYQAGGEIAQLYYPMIKNLNNDDLVKLRRRAEELNMRLEVLGGNALGRSFEDCINRAVTLGSKIVGCTFGFLMRPNKISTLEAWDKHTNKCLARLRKLAPIAKSLGIIIAAENHFDFTVDEMYNLIKNVNSPHVGILFDVGNIIGTLDDPTEAADKLGPLIVATHYK
ncbi:MAG: sugar phosphate isomerase/epimerase, partial [Planctomycetes bacterium]|nr:sugar phosphate isomerase/epimerase [Planctomycetota bacterium]